MTNYKQYYNSPIGYIEILANSTCVECISFTASCEQNCSNEITRLAVNQLHEYFERKRKSFSIPYQINGSAFSKSVLTQVATIKFGQTASYTTIAAALGNKSKVRAVGNVNSKNKLLLIIPCHRIIASNGNLTGYAGGLERKRWLLEHEGAIAQQSLF